MYCLLATNTSQSKFSLHVQKSITEAHHEMHMLADNRENKTLYRFPVTGINSSIGEYLDFISQRENEFSH